MNKICIECGSDAENGFDRCMYHLAEIYAEMIETKEYSKMKEC